MSIKAQKHEFLNPPKFNQNDLSKEKSSLDPNAPAEILYQSSSFMIDAKTELLKKRYFSRIKIYNRNKAEEWLNLEIPLYKSGSSDEYISKISAYTYNLEDGKVIEEKVTKDSKYKSKENKNVNITKFAFPNVKNGSIIEYQYEVVSPFLFSIPDVLIENNIPSLYTEYVLDVPAAIVYNMNYVGALMPVHKLVENRELVKIPYRTYRFGYENLKGFKTEKFVKNISNYQTKIKAELETVNMLGNLESYIYSWDQIGKNLDANASFGGQLRKTKFAKENMPASIYDIKNNQEKIDAIFNYVKKTYTWNKERGILVDGGFKELIEKKSGSAAEINFLLIMMLREAGIKAYPLLISTVDNGLINMVFPSTNNLDFVIAAVEANGRYNLYDATSKYSSMNELPSRDWNSYGILQTEKGVEQLEMINTKTSSKYLTVDAKIDESGNVFGLYSDRNTGIYSMFAKELFYENVEKYNKQYKENFAVDFTNIDSKSLENGDFESTMKFSSENLIDRVGKKLIINSILFLNKISNDFDQTEERKYPIEFISPYTQVKKIVIEIPEGYVIEEMPKNKKIVTDDKEIEYNYLVEQKGNKLEITSTTKVASANYQKEYYPGFKQIWGVASKQENQVISLVKK